jgi:hypothetical protein
MSCNPLHCASTGTEPDWQVCSWYNLGPRELAMRDPYVGKRDFVEFTTSEDRYLVCVGVAQPRGSACDSMPRVTWRSPNTPQATHGPYYDQHLLTN